jgi:glucans biosynthesis protein C
MTSIEPSVRAERIHGIDALRSVTMLLGVFYHAALPFVAAPIAWPILDRWRYPEFNVLAFTLHAFRMPTFFLLTGFFAHYVFVRLGPARFCWNRAGRILLPFLVCLFTVVPLARGVSFYKSLVDRFPAADPDPFISLAVYYASGAWLNPLSLLHLWFLHLLLFYYLGTLLAAFVGRFLAVGQLASSIRVPLRYVLASPALPLGSAALLLPAAQQMSSWDTDIPTSFIPRLHLLAYYSVFYLLGWVMFSHRDLLPRLAARWPAYLGLGGLAVLPLLITVLIPAAASTSGPTRPALDLVVRAAHSLMTTLLVLGLLGFFYLHVSRSSRIWEYLSDSAYWIYLVQLPLIMFLSATVAASELPALLKLLGVLVVGFGLLLISYHLCVRYTLIGWLLNGPLRTSGTKPSPAG